MEVNGTYVRNLRKSRGWTQQHLADACAVSLRTIQRVEKDGSASNETVMGLCAVFEVDQSELSIIPKFDEAALRPVYVRDLGIWVILAGIGGFILGIAAMALYLQLS